MVVAIVYCSITVGDACPASIADCFCVGLHDVIMTSITWWRNVSIKASDVRPPTIRSRPVHRPDLRVFSYIFLRSYFLSAHAATVSCCTSANGSATKLLRQMTFTYHMNVAAESGPAMIILSVSPSVCQMHACRFVTMCMQKSQLGTIGNYRCQSEQCRQEG